MLVKKNILIMHPTDRGACAFYRCNFMADLLRTYKAGEIEVIVSPYEITDEFILSRTAAVIVYRPLTEAHETLLQHYKRKRGKFGFKIFADYDDLVFAIDGKSPIPDYNCSKIDPFKAHDFIARNLANVDGITVSTRYLRNAFEVVFGFKNVILQPNKIPRYVFGRERRAPLKEDITKPVVLYAGSITHFNDDNPGDFAGPWIPWLKKAISEDRIEFHCFGQPKFLEEVKDKVVTHGYVSAIEFPSVIKEIAPHFYLAPLADNDFNLAKSNLKLLEASAIGAVLLGSWITYHEAPSMLCMHNVNTPKDLDDLVSSLCDRELFNTIIVNQYFIMDYKGYWMDSIESMNSYLKTFFGDSLNLNQEAR